MRVWVWLWRTPFSAALIIVLVVVHGVSGAFLGRLPRAVAGEWAISPLIYSALTGGT